MNILIDTHIAMWATSKSDRLTEQMRDLLKDKDNEIYYSIVSIWETAIKHAKHPDEFTLTEKEFDDDCEKSHFLFLDLKKEHVFKLNTLIYPDDAPEPHKDPFDRLLMAQAKSEGFMFMTHDHKIQWYKEEFVIYV